MTRARVQDTAVTAQFVLTLEATAIIAAVTGIARLFLLSIQGIRARTSIFALLLRRCFGGSRRALLSGVHDVLHAKFFHGDNLRRARLSL